MSDCLFCKIVNGQIPAKKVFENENVLAFNDINPSAKYHVLFVHKKHTEHVLDMVKTDLVQLTDIFKGIQEWTDSVPDLQGGFRVINNCGKLGGQTVFHTHFHVLGGQQMTGF